MVISNTVFNERVGLAIVCPITNTDRGWALHAKLPQHSSITGVIMCEQIKSVDFVSRNAKFIEKAPRDILNEVLAILDACIYENEP